MVSHAPPIESLAFHGSLYEGARLDSLCQRPEVASALKDIEGIRQKYSITEIALCEDGAIRMNSYAGFIDPEDRNRVESAIYKVNRILRSPFPVIDTLILHDRVFRDRDLELVYRVPGVTAELDQIHEILNKHKINWIKVHDGCVQMPGSTHKFLRLVSVPYPEIGIPPKEYELLYRTIRKVDHILFSHLTVLGWQKELNQEIKGSYGWLSWFLQSNGVLLDFNGFFRNWSAVLESSSELARTAHVVLERVAAPMAIASGVGVMVAGLDGAIDALIVKDKEGVIESALSAIIGLGFALVGIGLLFKTCGQKLSAVAGPLIQAAGIALYSALLIQSLFVLRYIVKFRSGLATAYKAGPQDSFKFIKELVTLTEQDEEMLRKIHRNEGPERQEAREKLIVAKQNAFKRRVGTQCALEVAQLVTRSTDVTDGEINALMQKIDQASFKIQVKKITHVAIAILGITAFVMPVPAVGAILFVVASVLWTTVDSAMVHDRVSALAWDNLSQITRRPSSSEKWSDYFARLIAQILARNLYRPVPSEE